MNLHFRLFSVALLCLGAVTATSAVHAQEPQPAKLYDQGVNAYFAGRSSEADALLSEAIQWNSQDPRAYYFRAFSLLRQGQVDEARGDMLVGATLEAQTPQRFSVGAALERIQGCDRLMLEQFRRDARRNVVVQASTTTTEPAAVRAPRPTPPQTMTYDQNDAAVLREPRIVPLEELNRPGGPHSIVEAAPATAPAAQPAAPAAEPAAAKNPDPFADDTQKTPVESAPATPAAAPVATPAAPAVTPPQATPPAATPPATPKAEAEENPFG